MGNIIDSGIRKRIDNLLRTKQVSIQGSNGSGVAFKVASDIVNGFNLDPDEVAEYLFYSDWNERCIPPWSPSELKHKCQDAYRTFTGTRGFFLANQRQSNQKRTASVKQSRPEPKAENKAEAVPKKSIINRTLYEYKDMNYTNFMMVERYDYSDGGKGLNYFVWNGFEYKAVKLDGVPRIPYNLGYVHRRKNIIIVEGEKTAVRLEKFLKKTNRWGLVAWTCFIGGCNGFTKYASTYAEYFHNKENILILADNDENGRKYAQSVGEGIRTFQKKDDKCRIRSAETFLSGIPPKYDFADWFDSIDWDSEYWRAQVKKPCTDGRLENEIIEVVKEYLEQVHGSELKEY
ncbi:MAG: hypothetical protein Q4C70_03855 [Planctomycetia bacterium]|nr:hypothetical protein [Planctomycetia bacterium]